MVEIPVESILHHFSPLPFPKFFFFLSFTYVIVWINLNTWKSSRSSSPENNKYDDMIIITIFLYQYCFLFFFNLYTKNILEKKTINMINLPTNSLFRTLKFQCMSIIYNIFNYEFKFHRLNRRNYKLFTELSNAITFPPERKMGGKIVENTWEGGKDSSVRFFHRFMQKRGRENWKHLKLLAVRGQAGPW